jgi:hypothetical protein
LQWANPLYERSLNLVDSLQAGRLFSCRGAVCRFKTNITTTINTTVVVLACLLLIWVSTYSLSGLFDAQSNLQSNTMLSLQTDASQRNQPRSGWLVISTPVRSPSALTIEQPYNNHTYRQPRQAVKAVAYSAAAYPVDDDLAPSTPLLSLPMTDETQGCDLRIVGRFTLCRV